MTGCAGALPMPYGRVPRDVRGGAGQNIQRQCNDSQATNPVPIRHNSSTRLEQMWRLDLRRRNSRHLCLFGGRLRQTPPTFCRCVPNRTPRTPKLRRITSIGHHKLGAPPRRSSSDLDAMPTIPHFIVTQRKSEGRARNYDGYCVGEAWSTLKSCDGCVPSPRTVSTSRVGTTSLCPKN